MDEWTFGAECPEADEAEDMLAKLCDIREFIGRRAALDRSRAYQRQAKQKQRHPPAPTPFRARKEAAPGSTPDAA